MTSASATSCAVMLLPINQPTTRCENRSITTATKSQPSAVQTEVKSATHSWFCRVAPNCGRQLWPRPAGRGWWAVSILDAAGHGPSADHADGAVLAKPGRASAVRSCAARSASLLPAHRAKPAWRPRCGRAPRSSASPGEPSFHPPQHGRLRAASARYDSPSARRPVIPVEILIRPHSSISQIVFEGRESKQAPMTQKPARRANGKAFLIN